MTRRLRYHAPGPAGAASGRSTRSARRRITCEPRRVRACESADLLTCSAAGFFARPELRRYGTYMACDEELNGFSYDGSDRTALGDTTFTGTSQFLLGAQMEMWF